MIEFIEWLRIFIFNHRSLEYIIIFFGTAFGGEWALFTLAFLAAQNVIATLPFIVLSFFGTFFSNTLWFLLGNSITIAKVITHRYANTTISIITQAIVNISKKNHFLALSIIKFIFGTPVILTMYVNRTKLEFKQFVYCESVAVFLSLFFYIPIGYISGLGFNYFAEILQNLYAAVGFTLLIIIIIVVIQLWLKKIFLEIRNNNTKEDFKI